MEQLSMITTLRELLSLNGKNWGNSDVTEGADIS